MEMSEIRVCSKCGHKLKEIIVSAYAQNTMKFKDNQYENPKKLEREWKIRIGKFECPNCHVGKYPLSELAISQEEYKRRQKTKRPRPPRFGEK